MARVTVEDCLDNVSNRFALVMVAAKRTRGLVTVSYVAGHLADVNERIQISL